MIGADADETSGTANGTVYLLYGKTDPFALTNVSELSAAQWTGEGEGDKAGRALVTVDINGDVFPELIVSAPYHDRAAQDAGMVYLGYIFVDNDGDGLSGDDGLLSGNDTDDTISYDEHSIVEVTGKKNGKIKVTYNDGAVLTYTIFDVTTSEKTSVALQPDSNKVIVLHPGAKQIAIVNGISGKVLDTVSLDSTKFGTKYLAVHDFRSDGTYEAVVVAKRQQTVRVVLLSIKTNKHQFKKRSEVSADHAAVSVKKTQVKNNTIRLRTKAGRRVATYKVNANYELFVDSE